MRASLALVFVAACGGQTVRPARPAPVHDGGTDAARDAAIEAGPNKLALLRDKHDALAPGAREATSADLDASEKRSLALPAFDADTCIRAAFDADAPTAITLEDSRGEKLGTADGTDGALGPSGPICFRKGDVATFRFNGESRLRIVVWATP